MHFTELPRLVFDVDHNESGTSKNAQKMTSIMERNFHIILMAGNDEHVRVDTNDPQIGGIGMAQVLPVQKMRLAFKLVDISCIFLVGYRIMP